MVNFGPLAAEICWRVWGTPVNFNWLCFVTAAMSLTGGQPNLVRCLAFSWAAMPYVQLWGLLPPDEILPGVQTSLCVQVLHSRNWHCYCTALEQQVRAKLCGMRQGMQLRNCRRARHLYLAGRPSCWASARILVIIIMWDYCDHLLLLLKWKNTVPVPSVPSQCTSEWHLTCKITGPDSNV